MSAGYLRLKGVTGVGIPLITRQIKENLINFFNWGFINMGGFSSIRLGASGTYGGDKSQLRPVQDPNYQKGTTTQVWESFTNEWVWESGILDFTQPIAISGVWVNNVFSPLSGNTFYINYKDGQVIFNTPIATGSKVQCEYSHRWCRFIDAETPWFREIFTNSERIDQQFFSTSGNYTGLSQARVPLPAVGVEINPNFYFTGMGQGQGTYLHQDVSFDIVTQDKNVRNQIMDLIKYQYFSTLIMYDITQFSPSLNYNGSLASGAKTYPDLINQTSSGTAYKKLFFEQMRGIDLGNVDNRIFVGSVRSTVFVNLDEV